MDAVNETHDRWTDRLSDYLDGELDAAERAALETHLASCRSCAVVLDELRAVVGAAAALEDTPPERELWPGIEARLSLAAQAAGAPLSAAPEAAGVISLAQRRRRFAFTLPQLAAAGVALVALSSTVVWLVTGRMSAPATSERPVAVGSPTGSGPAAARLDAGRTGSDARQGDAAASPTPPRGQSPAPTEARVASVEPPPTGAPVRSGARFVRAEGVREADAQYDRAVADLQGLLRREQGRLRPETVQALRKSLADIDRAIADARGALARDPANMYLNDHLAESMRMKLQLLRQATALAQS